MPQGAPDSNAQTNGARSWLETLHDISREIRGHVAHDQVQTICQRLGHDLAVDYVLVARCDAALVEGLVVAEYPPHLGKDGPLTLDGFEAYRQLQAGRGVVVVERVNTGAALLGPHQTRFQSLGLQTLFMVPLIAQDDLVGFLMVGTGAPDRALSQDELIMVQTVADQLASGLRCAELHAELQRHAGQRDQLAAFGRLVTGTLDHDQIWRHVNDMVPHLVPADQLHIARVTAGQSRMRVTILHRDEPPQEDMPVVDGSAVEEVLRTRQPLLVPDLRDSAYTDHESMKGRGLRSALVVPLTVGGRSLGALTAGHQRAGLYTAADQVLFQQIGSQIAAALDAAHQFQASQQRALYEKSLDQIAAHLYQQADLPALLQQVMQDLGQVLGAHRARVRLQVTPSESTSTRLAE